MEISKWKFLIFIFAVSSIFIFNVGFYYSHYRNKNFYEMTFNDVLDDVSNVGEGLNQDVEKNKANTLNESPNLENTKLDKPNSKVKQSNTEVKQSNTEVKQANSEKQNITEKSDLTTTKQKSNIKQVNTSSVYAIVPMSNSYTFQTCKRGNTLYYSILTKIVKEGKPEYYNFKIPLSKLVVKPTKGKNMLKLDIKKNNNSYVAYLDKYTIKPTYINYSRRLGKQYIDDNYQNIYDEDTFPKYVPMCFPIYVH